MAGFDIGRYVVEHRAEQGEGDRIPIPTRTIGGDDEHM